VEPHFPIWLPWLQLSLILPVSGGDFSAKIEAELVPGLALASVLFPLSLPLPTLDPCGDHACFVYSFGVFLQGIDSHFPAAISRSRLLNHLLHATP